MTVHSVELEDKIEMLTRHELGEETLTSIGEDFGISRKTVRRCIDEVNGILRRIEVGSTIRTLDNEVAEVLVVELPVQDDMPVKVRYTHNNDIEWIYFSNIDVNSIGSIVETDVSEELEVEVELEEPFPVGSVVRIRKDSEYYGINEGNPADCDGVIDRNDQDVEHLYRVTWETGIYNVYRIGDLEIATEQEEVAAEQEEVAAEVEEVQENAQYFVTAPQDSITIVRIDQDTGNYNQRQTNKHREDFYELRDRIRESQSQEVLRDIYMELDTKRMLESYSVGRVKVDAEQESVVFVRPDGSERKVPDGIASDIVETVKRHGRTDGDKLVKFLDKLMDNVSFKAIEGLYGFMKHNCIGINEDGSIQAWKGVDSDLYSHRGGDIKGSDTIAVDSRGRVYNGNFGTEIRVDRSEVDDDPDETCSKGLHVGNRDYASGWADTLLKVRVEPQDVVAVPKDYNGAKMRTCAYTPLEVVDK